jgi:hypothetical protein
MNYEKPTVNLLASAATAIQNQRDKSDPEYADADNGPFLATITAYEADE